MSPDTIRDLLPKLVRWVAILGVVLVVGGLVISFVTTGSLDVVGGSSDAAITISSLPVQGGPNQGQVATTKKGTGQLHIRLTAGTYIVSVQKGTAQTNQLVNVGWLSNQNVNLSPSSPTTTEPVLLESVQNIAADNNRLIYIDNDTNSIQYINSQNQDANVPGDQYYTSVAWANTSYGVAQDKSGKLYVIDGTSSRPLQTPINGPSLAYTIAPNKTIYLGLGSQVYRGTEASGFKQISSDFSPHDGLFAANDKVMMVNPGSSTSGGTATIIGTDDKTTTKKFSYPITALSSWSPSGKYIQISVGSTPEVYDSSLKQIATIPQPSAITGAWLDDNTLFYSNAGQLWSHDLSQNTSNLLASPPGQKLIRGITVSTDKAYVYFTASNSTDNIDNNYHPRAIYRVGLRGQKVPDTLSTLQDILPINSSTYSIGLRNFASPLTIDVVAYPGTDPAEVEQSARDTMQGIIDTNSVKFDIEAGD